jgi:peptidoglycan/LPS O-acetylase OafA/YrhL
MFNLRKIIEQPENSPHNRLYTVEFIRILLAFSIILWHCVCKYSTVKENALSFFHTKYMNSWFGVEFFFIIGGFFLWRQIQKATSATALIKKIYLRLLPALTFVFLVDVLLKTSHIDRFPGVLILTTGLSIPGEAAGWGDWYVGAYFWASCLFIGLFMLCRKQAFIWMFVLMYFTLCLKFHAPNDGWMKTYYTIIGNQFIRAIYSMGIGIFAAYLTERINIKRNVVTISFFTILEIVGFNSIFYYLFRTSHIHFNFLEMEIVFALLLISISKSLGVISTILNNVVQVQYVSRYSYSIFLSHSIFIKLFIAHQNYHMDEWNCAFIVFSGAIIVGVLEYHLIEQKFVPWIKKYFV